MPDYTGEKPKYQTLWVKNPSDLPNPGDTCPKCGVGTISEGKWGGVLCYECKTVWKMSKYTDKPHIPPVKIPQHSEEVIKLLKDIDDNLKELKLLVSQKVSKI